MSLLHKTFWINILVVGVSVVFVVAAAAAADIVTSKR